MVVVNLLMIAAFVTVLCIVEIPKMLKSRQYRDLAAFSVLLIIGTLSGIVLSLGKPLPTPSEWITWVFSPLEGITDFCGNERAVPEKQPSRLHHQTASGQQRMKIRPFRSSGEKGPNHIEKTWD